MTWTGSHGSSSLLFVIRRWCLTLRGWLS
jgi:hypothetical protein